MLGLQVQPVNIKFTEQGPTSLFRARTIVLFVET